MTNPVVKGKRKYRNFRPGPEGPRMWFHVSLSFLFSTTSTIFIEIFGTKELIVSNISNFNRFAGTSFALLFTVLAFIIAFEEQFSENSAIQQLKQSGHYSSIFQRFYFSVAIVGVVFIVSTIVGVLGLYEINHYASLPLASDFSVNIVELSIVFGVLFGLSVTIVRISSCFHIYYRIERIIREVQSMDK